jgi:CRP/FNR family transcriptional regulator, cyclic AMP receptor protein
MARLFGRARAALHADRNAIEFTRMSEASHVGVEAAFLAQTPLFGGLPEHALARIIAVSRVLRVEAATRVFEEGEPALGMFVLREGELEICKRKPGGGEFRLAVLQRGDCLGEMALIDIQPRSATVRALSPSLLYALERAQLAQLYATDLEVYTLLMLNIAREISRRLRRADQRLVEMGVAVTTV